MPDQRRSQAVDRSGDQHGEPEGGEGSEEGRLGDLWFEPAVGRRQIEVEQDARDDVVQLEIAEGETIISVAGAVGATTLQRLAQELNAAAKAADPQLAKPLNSKCIQGISTVVTFLNNEKTG